MARIRTIKPEFWVSEQVAECSTNARLTFVGLWNFCDDQGVHPAKPKTLKAELFPMDDVTAEQVGAWVSELLAAGLIAEFEADGVQFWHVTGWDRHQKIDRPSFKYPSPPKISETTRRADSSRERRTLDEDSSSDRRAPPPGMEWNGKDGKGVEARSLKAHAPAADADGVLTVKDLEAKGIDAQLAADWLRVRKAKKAILTVTAWNALEREAGKAGITPAQAVQVAAERGWQSFKAEYLTGGAPAATQQARPRPVLNDDFVFGSEK